MAGGRGGLAGRRGDEAGAGRRCRPRLATAGRGSGRRRPAWRAGAAGERGGAGQRLPAAARGRRGAADLAAAGRGGAAQGGRAATRGPAAAR